ncbi:unnamed protein product [Heterobilharzia americana]|nr:unnamed protein product [Heterobilharzia americana]
MNNLLIENLESWQQLQKNAVSSNIDPHLLTFYGGSCCPVELSSTSRRKNATRETTSMLKAWLNEHRKNPYPTKGEKIMLALITKMSLTQVSTWFANARRRLKKENKVTWNLRTDCSSDVEQDGRSVEDDDGDDFDDDSVGVSHTHNQVNNEHDLSTITGLEGLKQYLISKHSENYEKLSMGKLFDKHGCLGAVIEGGRNKLSRIRSFPNGCDQTDSIPKKRASLDIDKSVCTPTPTSLLLNAENEQYTEKSGITVKPKTRKIWSLVDIMNEKHNSDHSHHETSNEKNPIDLQNSSCENWFSQSNRNLQSAQNFFKSPYELSTCQVKMSNVTADSFDSSNIDRKPKDILSSVPNFVTADFVPSTATGSSSHFPSGSSSLFSPSTLAAFYLYYQQHLQHSQEQNQSSMPSSLSSLTHQQPSTEQQKPYTSKFCVNSSNLNNNLLYPKLLHQRDENFSSLFHGNINNLDLLNRETQQYARSLCLHRNHSNHQITTSPSDES